MPLEETGGLMLKIHRGLRKWGLIVLRNPDGTVREERVITGEQLAEFRDGIAKGVKVPPGVDEKEWQPGLAMLYGKDEEPGDMKIMPNGTVLIWKDRRVVDARVVLDMISLSPGEWSGVPPAISVSDEIAEKIGARIKDGELLPWP